MEEWKLWKDEWKDFRLVVSRGIMSELSTKGLDKKIRIFGSFGVPGLGFLKYGFRTLDWHEPQVAARLASTSLPIFDVKQQIYSIYILLDVLNEKLFELAALLRAI
ncbi:hypothetical protein WN51_07588 [Melipona quadrifasciata]|uniref:Uncharacterized protein n=1 Tax=Melipona quadrifasciata TaxID=166423 RepID=A0A0M8ZPN2_9HYME|nr:hypothetical protein WN51_07588 [Melipona quadrifasciata]